MYTLNRLSSIVRVQLTVVRADVEIPQFFSRFVQSFYSWQAASYHASMVKSTQHRKNGMESYNSPHFGEVDALALEAGNRISFEETELADKIDFRYTI